MKKSTLSPKEQEVVNMARKEAEKLLKACEDVSSGKLAFGEFLESRLTKRGGGA